MHSSFYLGTSLAVTTPDLIDDCDIRNPWQADEVVEGGRLSFEKDVFKVPDSPGVCVML